MGTQPWFKLYAADYLVDQQVDAIPREADGLLLRMWCICHLEGSCPADTEELARKTRCTVQYVLQCKPHCEPLFELRGDRLYSRRMEAEKRRSQQASKNASERYKEKTSAVSTVNRTAVGSADCSAASDYDYDSNSLKKLPKTNQFNSTEVAQIVCQQNGWSGQQMIWTFKDAIEFQAKRMPELSLEQVAEWLVRAYRDQEADKGRFAVGPQKFFAEGRYQSGAPKTAQKPRNLADRVMNDMMEGSGMTPEQVDAVFASPSSRVVNQ